MCCIKKDPLALCGQIETTYSKHLIPLSAYTVNTMKSAKIILIAPDLELYQTAIQIRHEVDFPYEIVLASLDDAVFHAERLKQDGALILVSRGGTLDKLRNNFPDTPIVTIPITEYEVVATLAEAKKIASRAAVVGFSSPLVQRADRLAPAIGLELRTYQISSQEDVEFQVLAAYREGAEVIIGFELAYNCAEKLGIPAVLMQSQHDVVKHALSDAHSLLAMIIREEEWKERQTTVLNSISSAIFITDKNGAVSDCNRTAEPLFELLGKGDIFHSIFSGHFVRVLQGETISNLFRRIGMTDYNCSLYPVSLHGQISGAVVILEELSRLREIEQTARRKLVETGLKTRYQFEDILTTDPTMCHVIDKCRRYARNDSTVMLYGESGTGKELLTQSIHSASARSGMPFVAINCGALPENLLESELFGYVEGAFTGARRGGKIGAFELAHRGTLFLDEIGEISPVAQLRLLRTLEERQIIRLGDTRIIPVDVRIICASHADLSSMCDANLFRRDLFYRLNVLEVSIPPLRQRKGDIRPLLEYYIDLLTRKAAVVRPQLTSEAVALAESYNWPGNVRELRNVAERIVIGLESDTVSREDMAEVLRLREECHQTVATQTIKDQETLLIQKTLAEYGNNRTQTAKALGMSKSTLWRRMKDF